jgi:hypothetical protein
MTTQLTYTSGTLGAEHDEAFESALAAAREADPAVSPSMIAGRPAAGGPVFEREDPADTQRVASRARARRGAATRRTAPRARPGPRRRPGAPRR